MATPKFSITNFKVKGTGEFPLDMLRYDSCCPISSEDSSLIKVKMGARQEERIIALRKFYPVGGTKDPTWQRWLSFGWEVVS